MGDVVPQPFPTNERVASFGREPGMVEGKQPSLEARDRSLLPRVNRGALVITSNPNRHIYTPSSYIFKGGRGV